MVDIAVDFVSGASGPIMDSAALPYLYVGSIRVKIRIIGAKNIFDFEDIRNVQQVVMVFSPRSMARNDTRREVGNGATRPNMKVGAVGIGVYIAHRVGAGGFIERALGICGSRRSRRNMRQ